MKNILQKNKELFLMVLFIILIPVAFHIGYNYVQIIPTIDDLPSNVWLLFFGSYLGGAATLIAVYISSRKNGEANRKLINRQWKEKKFSEYKKTLLANIDVANIPDMRFGLSSLSLDRASLLDGKNSIINKKKNLYACDVAYRITSRIENRSNPITEESDYYNHWKVIIQRMSSILDAQVDIIQLGLENDNNTKSLRSMYEQRPMLRKVVEQSNEEKDKKELDTLMQEISIAEQKHNSFIPEFDSKFKLYEETYKGYENTVRALYDLTVLLLDAKEKEVDNQ